MLYLMIQKGNNSMLRWYTCIDGNEVNRGRSRFIRCIYCNAAIKNLIKSLAAYSKHNVSCHFCTGLVFI